MVAARRRSASSGPLRGLQRHVRRRARSCVQSNLPAMPTIGEGGLIPPISGQSRVELADALKFLTDFLAASGKGDGLVVEPLMRGSIPAGVAARLELDLPDLQLGVFGISNLSLHILFGVAA